ncbi:glycosyltransferase family 4 protein [Mucilaginibacter ximonensis]|uniref:Glycosyltransferase family 4 protein n=1 Tax=Mucilaginibacter ximonensis TaxID=538021 RepID=A0ABW5YB12_9SPHI
MVKLVRITTVPISLDKLLQGQLKYMRGNGFDVKMISSWDEKLPLIAERETSGYVAINMKRAISPFDDIISLIKLIKTLKKLKPDIVHTHTPKAGLLGMCAAWLVKTPIRLHTVAGLPLMETTGVKRNILEAAERWTYRFANKVYPNSKNLQQFILDNRFCSASKLKVIGNGSSNGINTENFKLTDSVVEQARQLKSKLLIGEQDFVFTFVGRLVKDKGIEELVQSFSVINKKHPKTRLLLVGPFEPELDPLSNDCLIKIQSNKTIINAGFQNDIKPYLAISSALVFPSYREGFPNVPMQAGCFNLPAIVTNINGCNEIINQGENGLIIPPKNIEALTDAMERLFTDKLLYNKMKINARKMIVDRYEQTYFWSLLLKEYQQHLKQHGIS